MTELDYVEQLRARFRECSLDKRIEAAHRAALRGFVPVNLNANRDVSETAVFPRGRLLLQSIVYAHFGCAETKLALERSISTIDKYNLLLQDSAMHSVAQASYSRSSDKAWQTISRVATSFASAANQEQFLFAKTKRDWSTRHAYDNALSITANVSISDFDEASGKGFNQKLWLTQVDFHIPMDQRNIFEGYFRRESFEFWRTWHQGFVEGKPLDWEFQRRVALIDEAIWNSGPDAVAAEIERIGLRRKVESAHAELSESLHTQATVRHGIGGNNPPERIQDERLSDAITLIWEAKEELSTALEQENPAHGWIEAILAKFKVGLTSLLKWCAGKVNLAVGTAIVVGTTKGSTLVVDTYIAKHPEKIEALIEALERWLPFLS